MGKYITNDLARLIRARAYLQGDLDLLARMDIASIGLRAWVMLLGNPPTSLPRKNK